MRRSTIPLLALALLACAAAGQAAADTVKLRGAQGLEAPAAPAAAPAPAPHVRRTGPDHAVQIGVFTSAKIANERWAGIKNGFGPSLKAKRLRVIPIRLEGRRAFRTQIAGFKTRSAASGFCAALSRAGHACFVPPARS